MGVLDVYLFKISHKCQINGRCTGSDFVVMMKIAIPSLQTLLGEHVHVCSLMVARKQRKHWSKQTGFLRVIIIWILLYSQNCFVWSKKAQFPTGTLAQNPIVVLSLSSAVPPLCICVSVCMCLSTHVYTGSVLSIRADISVRDGKCRRPPPHCWWMI